MRPEIDSYLSRHGGAASRAQLLTIVSRHALDDEVARGHLAAPFPRAHCRPWDVDHLPVLERAAVASVGGAVALSHVNALRRYGLIEPATDRVHVTVPVGRHPIGRRPGLYVHRTRIPTPVRTIDGVLTVSPAIAIVRSWPVLTGPDRRSPAISAVRTGLVSPEQLRRAADAAVGMAGRAQLLRLAALLSEGCESELELWGFVEVFDAPGLRHGVQQLVVEVRGRRYRLDLGYRDERVAVELDGYRFHSGRAQREHDMERDAALASIGWLTLRFSHERLHADVAGCRRDALASLAARRPR